MTQADLGAVERAIGHALPPQYREFMLIANGGTLPYSVRLPPDSPDGQFVSFLDLYTINGDGWGSLLGGWRFLPKTFIADQLPAGVLPVATDGGGSELFIDLREGTFGAVWAFVHGLPDWAGGDNIDRGGAVAADWQGYLDMLTVDEEYAEEVWTDNQPDPDPSWTAALVSWLDSGLPDWRSRPWAAADHQP